jgi:putative ABC transport system permease protein
MTWLRLFRRQQADIELQQEIEAHLAAEIGENMARGMSPMEARRQSRIKFGNPQKIREDLWRQNSLTALDSGLRDPIFAARTLRRRPGFALIAILVMAFGIGASVASFTIVRSVLLNPLPFPNPERLVRLYEKNHTAETGGTFSEWKTESQSFSDMGIGGSKSHNLSGSGDELPENVRGGMFSWSVLATLGVQPALGRNFTEEEDQRSANPTVLLSWGLWKRRFGGSPTIVNQTIRLDAKLYTVVGVMPAWFAYPDSTVQLWTPIYYEERPSVIRDIGNHQFWVIGRLKPGVTQAQGVAELTLISRRVHDQHRDIPFVADSASASPLLESIVGDVKTPLYILLGATACVLLIACLNVANLLVARSAARRKEHSIRMALGGGRLQLLRQHLMESFLLSCAGGGLGLVLAWGAIEWVIRARQDMARVEAIRIDGYGAAATVGLVALCALLTGLVSSFNVRGVTLLATLQQSSRANSAGRASVRLRSVLLSLEVGLTMVLLIAAGLLLKSYGKLHSANLGCVTENVLKMDIRLPATRYPKMQVENFFETFLSRVRSLPGIHGAGFIKGGVPADGYGIDDGFVVVEHPALPADQRLYAIHRWVDPGYFAAIGIPIQGGRTFDWNQQFGHATEIIISESFARRYFPGEDPLGKHLSLPDDPPREIVAVVGDTRFAPGESAKPVIYSQLLTDPAGETHSATLVVRSDSDVTQFAIPIQRLLWQLDRDIPASDILTLDQVVGRSTLNVSFDAYLLAAFAGMSLLLAAVGLFGVLSYIVVQRTSEMGIRIALGAQRKQLLQLVLVDGLRPALVGLGLGLAASAGLTQLIRSMLYQTEPLDPAVFVEVGFVLLLVATAACVIPAWRASQLDPMRALRT